MQNFWNFQVIPTTKIIMTLVQNKLVLKLQAIPMDTFLEVMKAFFFCFWVKDEVTFGWSQKV
jgi:hypothetical protein